MRYEKISSELFIQNRKNLMNALPDNSVVILASNAIMPTNADGIMGFVQNSDLYYLTGIDQEDTYLVILKSENHKPKNETLFTKKTNEHIKIWEGQKLSKEEAIEVSGINSISWNEEFEDYLIQNISENHTIYTLKDEPILIDFKSKNSFLKDKLVHLLPNNPFENINDILHRQRTIKSEIEISLIKKAIEITKISFIESVKKIKDLDFEFEIEADLTYNFIKNRSRNHAFLPIVASGKNACILHYVENNDFCQDNDLILIDFGAEYANYKADITRVVPKNGKFNKRQLEVYQSVLRIFEFAKSQMYVNNSFENLNNLVSQFVERELVKLGLVTDFEINNQDKLKPVYKRYFPHGVSHFLGLDVHDVGGRNLKFEENMVLTCEPGIYIEEEGIGIRLENNILLSKSGPIDLCDNFPLFIPEIEELMN